MIFRPKMIIAGASAYPRQWDYARIRKICDATGAFMLTDMAPGPGQALIMYSQLSQHQMIFHNAWNGDVVLMMECDVLKACPAKQVWPWCAWCRKFLLPVEDHRNSKKHQSFRRQLMEKGPEQIRQETLAHLRITMG